MKLSEAEEQTNEKEPGHPEICSRSVVAVK
jgi:hypothetical protein